MRRIIVFQRIPGLLVPLYEKATRLVIDSYYGPLARNVVAFLKAGKILDLGTGPGYLPVEILKRSDRLTITALDLSPRLIRAAGENAHRAGVADRVCFRVGNAAKIPFRASAFDMVISTGMLHMLRDPVRVLQECHRVLKPGGEAWIFDPAQVSAKVDMKVWISSLTVLERILFRLFRLYTKLNPARSYTREELTRMIQNTPFREYRIQGQAAEVKLTLRKAPVSQRETFGGEKKAGDR
jgi:ubiquinone/menaquinone biosynthesis C-methylase UbiE